MPELGELGANGLGQTRSGDTPTSGFLEIPTNRDSSWCQILGSEAMPELGANGLEQTRSGDTPRSGFLEIPRNRG